MKTAYRVLAILLCLLTALTFISCGEDAPDVPMSTGDEQSMSPPAEPTGYFGTLDGYVYRYNNGRNREWEEDVLYLAETFLNSHPVFFEKTLVYGVISDETDKFYNPSLKNEFIAQIDGLINRIPDLEDHEILYELKRIAALFEDMNTDVIVPADMFFPLRFTAINENGETAVYVVSAPKDHPEIIFGRLEAINGMPTNDVLSRLCEYVCADSQYLRVFLTVHNNIINAQMLDAAGIIDAEPYTAEFTVMTEDGSVTVAVSAIPLEENTDDVMESKSLRAAGSLSKKNSEYYWHENLPDEGMVFARLNYCYQREDLSYSDFWYQIMKDINSYEIAPRVVIDLRGNLNGYEPTGFDGFVASLRRANTSGVYILIDSGTRGAAVQLAIALKQELENAVVMGEPAGQSPNFLGPSSYSKFKNHEDMYFKVSKYCYVLVEDYGETAYMPDEIIYQTFEDYKQGIDTVMEAVKNAE